MKRKGVNERLVRTSLSDTFNRRKVYKLFIESHLLAKAVKKVMSASDLDSQSMVFV